MAKVDPQIYIGRARAVEYAVRKDGTMPAKEFLSSLSTKDQAKLSALFRQLGDLGEKNNNPQRFCHEREGIYAFKWTTKAGPTGGKGLIRFPCFRHGNRWILTHGFWKPLNDNKWPEKEFTLAFEIRDEVLQREKSQS